MTVEPIRHDDASEEVPSFTPPPAADPATVRQGFQIAPDDTILHTRRPKTIPLLNLVAQIEEGSETAQASAAIDFLNLALDPETRTYLSGRLNDDDDDFDITHLYEPMEHFVGLWYGRPTGQPSASASSPQRTGAASTVRRRSQG